MSILTSLKQFYHYASFPSKALEICNNAAAPVDDRSEPIEGHGFDAMYSHIASPMPWSRHATQADCRKTAYVSRAITAKLDRVRLASGRQIFGATQANCWVPRKDEPGLTQSSVLIS
jgi:hypothetical protein